MLVVPSINNGSLFFEPLLALAVPTGLIALEWMLVWTWTRAQLGGLVDMNPALRVGIIGAGGGLASQDSGMVH